MPAAIAPDKPEAFLRWSMDRYKTVPSFRVKASVVMNYDGMPGGAPQEREFTYDKPNRFKVVSTGAGGFIQTSIADGKSIVEYASIGGDTQTSPAPVSVG